MTHPSPLAAHEIGPLGRSVAPRAASDGTGLLAAVTAAVARLEAHVDEVDALNVFPVPDGDTGTNMLATLRAALAEAAAIPAGKHTLESVVAALRHGALMGARGERRHGSPCRRDGGGRAAGGPRR